MVHRFDGPIRLDARQFTTSDVVRLSGVPDRTIRNWLAPPRCTLSLGERHLTGRILFSLLDVLQFTVMHDLTARVPLKPSDAVRAAQVLANYVAEHAPRDAEGHPIADPNATPRSFAFALYAVDGVMCIEGVDSSRPGAHVMADIRYGRAHILLPVARLVGDVLYALIEMVNSQAPGRTA